jgi:hypothetical protein
MPRDKKMMRTRCRLFNGPEFLKEIRADRVFGAEGAAPRRLYGGRHGSRNAHEMVTAIPKFGQGG